MTWAEARQQFPDTWLLFEALRGRIEDGKWWIDDLTVIRSFAQSSDLMKEYARLRREYPEREFGFYHTSHDSLGIQQQWWMGLRPA